MGRPAIKQSVKYASLDSVIGGVGAHSSLARGAVLIRHQIDAGDARDDTRRPSGEEGVSDLMWDPDCGCDHSGAVKE